MRAGLDQTQKRVLSWFSAEGRDFPWRRTRDPYRTLVAEVMLQQTQTSRVMPSYHTFLTTFPDVRSLASRSARDVIAAWRGLGYNRRALALRSAAQAIVRDHKGRVPKDVETLRNLPGIGPYTASAVVCFAYDEQIAVVDVNVRRVLARLVHGAEAHEVPTEMMARTAAGCLPSGKAYEWNQALMDIGATLCRSRAAACGECPLRARCAFRRGGRRPEPAGSPKESFAGSRRQVRGAVVEALRSAAPGGATLGQLSAAVVERGGAAGNLAEILAGLERDGLVAMSDAARTGGRRGRVRLPV